ncbi:hypothetical protein LVY75_35340 (plasmid) [Sinorhizobium sp. B11]
MASTSGSQSKGGGAKSGGSKSASSSSDKSSSSAGKQGGTHEQHVKAGEQSHKNSK